MSEVVHVPLRARAAACTSEWQPPLLVIPNPTPMLACALPHSLAGYPWPSVCTSDQMVSYHDSDRQVRLLWNVPSGVMQEMRTRGSLALLLSLSVFSFTEASGCASSGVLVIFWLRLVSCVLSSCNEWLEAMDLQLLSPLCYSFLVLLLISHVDHAKISCVYKANITIKSVNNIKILEITTWKMLHLN